MNSITAAWISTIGHILCELALVALIVWIVIKCEEGEK